MKTFWKILPLALPLLVLIAVLSSCGKSNKITANMFNRLGKAPIIGTSADIANGSAPVALADPAFRQGCKEKKGQLELAAGGLCVVQVEKKNLDPTVIGDDQPILPEYHEGDLIISAVAAGTLDSSIADIRLGGEHLMNFGERAMPKVSTPDHTAPLSMLLLGQVSAVASVTVWTCFDKNLHHVYCNADVFRHR